MVSKIVHFSLVFLVSIGQLEGRPDVAVQTENRLDSPVNLTGKTPVELIGLVTELLLDKEKYQETISHLTQVITENPSVAAYYRCRAFLLLKTKLVDDAIEDVEKAIALDPRDLESHALLQSGRFIEVAQASDEKRILNDETSRMQEKKTGMDKKGQLEVLIAYLVRVVFEDTELEVRKLKEKYGTGVVNEDCEKKIMDLESKRDEYVKQLLFLFHDYGGDLISDESTSDEDNFTAKDKEVDSSNNTGGKPTPVKH